MEVQLIVVGIVVLTLLICVIFLGAADLKRAYIAKAGGGGAPARLRRAGRGAGGKQAGQVATEARATPVIQDIPAAPPVRQPPAASTEPSPPPENGKAAETAAQMVKGLDLAVEAKPEEAKQEDALADVFAQVEEEDSMLRTLVMKLGDVSILEIIDEFEEVQEKLNMAG